MKALVLGGAGFIGSALTDALRLEGTQVRTVDDYSRGHHTVDAVRDLTNASEFDDLAGNWDEVYLLAAVVGVPNVLKNPFETIRVNTRIVLNTVERLRPKKLFFASTSEVYADSGPPFPTPEDVLVSVAELTHPRTVYAASKILGESAVTHSGIPYVIGRFHNVYGPDMGEDHVIPAFCRKAQARENPFTIDDALVTRTFCYVEDAVRGILTAMRSATNVTVNIGSDREESTLVRLAHLVTRIAGYYPDVKELMVPQRIVRRCPDLTKLRSYGYEPTVDLYDGISKTYAWYSTHPA